MKSTTTSVIIAILLISGFGVALAEHEDRDPDRILPICEPDIKDRREATKYALDHKCCFPELPPTYPPVERTDDKGNKILEGGGCGLIPFFEFLRGIIRFFTLRLMPVLAAIFVVAGGFVIMTSTGQPEKYSKGKKMITIALTGALITLAAYLIVQTIFTALTGNLYEK